MPTPTTNETEAAFIDRCIPLVIDEGTAEDATQARAVCQSIFDANKSMKKKFHAYEVKTLSLAVKDVDQASRRVKMVLSKFDNVDSDRDVIRKGAFTKSILERGPDSTSNRKIAFLRYHNWEHQIGKFISLEETDEGLIAIGDMGTSTKGEDALRDYQEGLIREHSIGFNYIQDKMQLFGEGDQAFWEVKELFLWEGSAVTFGANSLTPTLDVSKGEHIAELDKINKEMTRLTDSLRNGKGTDDRLFQIEMALKVCQQKYNSLINLEPIKFTPKGEPNKQDEAKSLNEARKKQLLINLLK